MHIRISPRVAQSVLAKITGRVPQSQRIDVKAYANIGVIPDAALSSTSKNCVQNKVIYAAISALSTLINGKASANEAAKSLTLEINSTTHQITAKLFDKDLNLLSESSVNASPASAVIVDGYYDEDTEKIILDLSTGTSIAVSVADLVNGLASEESLSAHTSNTAIHVTSNDKQNWNSKQNALTAGSNVSIVNGVISVTIPVSSVNGKTGTVVLTSDDIEDTSAASTSTISNSFRAIRASIQDILTALLGKQPTLTAGANVAISDSNVISATDTVYDDTEVRGLIDGVEEDLESAQNAVEALDDRVESAEQTVSGMSALMTSLAQSKASTEYVDQKVAEIETPDIPDPSSANPQMDGTASPGNSNEYARANHVHPTDTSRASAADMAAAQNNIAALQNDVDDLESAVETATQDISTLQDNVDSLEENKANTEDIPTASDDLPLQDNDTASAGISEKFSRSDHKHPRDGDLIYWVQHTFQTLSNLVTSFASGNDDTHYPSAKLVKDNLDSLKAYVDDKYGPHTVWEAADPSNGLSASGGKSRNIDSDNLWQLTGLDMSAYKYVLAYIKACSGSVVDQEGFSMVVRINLDAASATPRSGFYIGSHIGYYPNDNGVKYGCVCNVDATKTKFCMNYCNANTTGTTALERDGKVYKIEGYK